MSFTAQYYSDCAGCDHKIEPGQEAEFSDDDELYHVDCEDSGELAPAEPPLCTACFMHHRGECL
ncbi:hypothetical protein SEA_VANLEE_109 [Gordonia phage VanLee]|uniref:Uncharacterized protein n=1 Tax=Gordonia phage VanLee TaxID=2845816 RepID=A0A8F2DAE0_9CAUD|nr:hypothetical protein QEH49_gp109 [Gordonia phage VanLee]QWS68226.1 hypothetical protein SEA_VANLEE_109 [Gordonia phage VanLee]